MNKRNKFLILALIFLLLGIALFFIIYTHGQKVNILTQYYSATKIKSTCEYEIKNGDTILQGKFIKYNQKGGKITEGNFVNDEPSGKWIYYSDDGVVECIHFRVDTKRNTESIWNYPSGILERYVMYDEFGSAVYIIRFDEQGNIKNDDGSPLIETYQYKIKYPEDFKTKINQYLKVGDTLKHQYLLADIPNVKRTFKVENVGVDNTKIKRKITKVSRTVLDIKEVLTKKGLNIINFIVEYEFNDKDKTIQTHELTFEIMVN